MLTHGKDLMTTPQELTKQIVFLSILGPPYCGIGATIRIGREMLCLPYAGFFLTALARQGLLNTCTLFSFVSLFFQQGINK